MTLLHCGLYGTLAVLLLTLLRWLFRRRTPAWLWPCLWLLAGLRFLLPFGMALPFVPEPVMEAETALQTFLTAEISVETVAETIVPAGIYETAAAETLTPDEQEAYEIWLENSGRLLTEMQAERDRTETLAALRTLLTRLWVMGSVLCGGYFLLLYLLMCRRFRLTEEIPSPTALPTLRRHIRFGICRAVDTPVTCGILRPRILLPVWFGEETAEARRMMLLHEFCHIRRFDVLSKTFLLAVTAVHWWNPAAWLMLGLAGRDMEFASDAAAVRLLAGDSHGYAEVLLSAAEKRLAARQVHRLALPFGESPLSARITALLDGRKTNRWLAAVLLCGMAMVLVCCVPAQVKEPADSASQAAPEASAETEFLLTEEGIAREEAIKAEYFTAKAEEDALNAALEMYLEELHAAAALQEKMLADLETQYTHNTALIRSLKDELTVMLENRDVLLAGLEDKMEELARLQTEYDSCIQTLAQLDENGLTSDEYRESEVLLEKIRQLNLEIAGKQSEADALQQRYDSMLASTEQCTAKISQLQGTLDLVQEKIELTRAQLEKIRTEME